MSLVIIADDDAIVVEIVRADGLSSAIWARATGGAGRMASKTNGSNRMASSWKGNR